ncbi:MAG: J domain-containing protein [Parasporobacterium sp.]|nr:J domain-containing protein [Parasporobacterium sp.]
MIDPYKVLGIQQGASEEEIKKAYRQKAKLYHPDLHPNDSAAAAKMNEVNEAYDMLKNPEKYERKRAQEQQQQAYRQQSYSQGSSYGNYGYDNPYNRRNSNQEYYGGGFYGFDFGDFFNNFGGYGQTDTRPHVQAGDDPSLVNAINSVNAGRYAEAVSILSAMPSPLRNARWYYVSAVAHKGKGEPLRALDHITRASEADPGNIVYKQLLRQYQHAAQGGSADSSSRGNSGFSVLRLVGIGILIMLILRLLFSCMIFY